MITEDYVSFETAKLLKEKWFDEGCRAFYVIGEESLRFTFYPMKYNNNLYLHPIKVSAPTLQMTMKWLREVHHLTIDVFHSIDWRVNIKTIPDNYFKTDYSYPELKPTKTYEEAVETAIKYCLENLI